MNQKINYSSTISDANLNGISAPIAGASRNRVQAAVAHQDLPELRRELLAWYSASKRDLDWRRTRDPYRIWLSEIMLQQTRVAAVIPYYRRFLARFPTVQHLAKAPLDSVMRYWSGLGYYSRARNVHQAAKKIVTLHGGNFPSTRAEALELPGIGDYTAAAVLSIAYNAPLAVVDGNVARVLARLTALRGDLRRPAIWRRLIDTADAMLARSEPGNWNQALMELGAVVCTPRTPRCAECPISRWCRARDLGITGMIPAPRRTPATVRIVLAAAVLLDPHGRTLVVRHPKIKGQGSHADRDANTKNSPSLFSRLWQFPSFAETISAEAISKFPGGEPAAKTRGPISASANVARRKAGIHSLVASSQDESDLLPLLAKRLAIHLRQSIGVIATHLTPLPTARHGVTFRNIRLAPFLVPVSRLPSVTGARTPRLTAVPRLPISSATRKIAIAALHSLKSSCQASHPLPVSRRASRDGKKQASADGKLSSR